MEEGPFKKKHPSFEQLKNDQGTVRRLMFLSLKIRKPMESLCSHLKSAMSTLLQSTMSGVGRAVYDNPAMLINDHTAY